MEETGASSISDPRVLSHFVSYLRKGCLAFWACIKEHFLFFLGPQRRYFKHCLKHMSSTIYTIPAIPHVRSQSKNSFRIKDDTKKHKKKGKKVKTPREKAHTAPMNETLKIVIISPLSFQFNFVFQGVSRRMRRDESRANIAEKNKTGGNAELISRQSVGKV